MSAGLAARDEGRNAIELARRAPQAQPRHPTPDEGRSMPEPELPAGAPEAPIDRPGRPGNIWLVLALALAVVGASVAFSVFNRDWAEPFVAGLLAILSFVALVGLFGWAVGLVDVAGRTRRFDLTKALVDGLPDGALVTDAEGRIVYANAAYLAITGADGARDVRTIERVYSGDPDVAEAIYRLTLAAREGRAQAEEVRVVGRGEGQAAQWLKLRVQPFERQGQGRVTLWTVVDVTRDRERQENIVQELQHAIDYLDHAPAGFVSVEPNGQVAYMNATLATLLDRDLGEAAAGGLTIADLVPAGQASLFTNVAARPGEVRTEVLDIDLLTRSGRSRPARLLHRVSFAADGTPGASRTLVIDRAPGSDASEPLRAAEVRFARFFNSAPMAIATVDRYGALVRSNAPFARLFPALAGRGRPLIEVVAEKDRPGLQAALDAAKAGQGAVPPVDVALAGEATRSGRFYVSAVEDAQKDDEAALVFAVETTEQRALELQFAQSQKMNAVGQLAGGIAHDFNNVLTAIIGFSDLLLANHRPSDPSFQDIMNIKQNANRAAGLVRQLLAFSRRQTLRPQVLNLGDTLSDLTILLGRLLGERIKLDVKHGRDLWFVKADLNQFEQVIVNLAVNARDAMPDGGRLSIATRNVPAAEVRGFGHAAMPEADHVLIEVADTGTGIPQDILDKIFEPFFSTKEIGKGTGLGLSTVYGIVKQTGGFVFVESQPGAGATFRIFLPRHEPTPAEAAARAEKPDRPAADLTGQGTVLLVEDEEAVRAFAARALTSRGYKVLEAGSGAQAIEAMREHGQEVALVVSDVVMPEMDGPTLLKELRRLRPDLKIVFMSGYAEEAFRKNLEEGESFAFLPKPFSLKQLAQAVKDNMPS
jgi:two-component system cell cycle sensor histidine kinase/response regulator CckA